MQNRSHAVMAQRLESRDSLDDFPTPPWATRALMTHVIGGHPTGVQTCLEPACNRGFMSSTLAEYFKAVQSSDVCDYGFGEVRDFLKDTFEAKSVDWMITNPPFKLGEEFISKGLEVARVGVAVLARTVFIESVGRYERLFLRRPPTKIAQFAERVPMVKGRLDRKASTATGYCWLVWESGIVSGTQLLWIPPCRKALERASDYQQPVRTLPRAHQRRLPFSPGSEEKQNGFTVPADSRQRAFSKIMAFS